MDGVPVVLTTRIPGAGWRLGGARVRVVDRAAAAAAFEDASASAPLVLVEAALAAALPPARLAGARRAASPPVLVLPGDGATDVPDVAAFLRRALGVAR